MTTIHPSDDPMQLADTAWGRAIGLSPAEQSTLNMADATCQALFGTSTVRETTHSIMQDAKQMTSASPAAEMEILASDGAFDIKTQRFVMRPPMPTTPQEAVVSLQHVINRFEAEPDVIFAAAIAIADIATEAAENGTIVDPLMGSDFAPDADVQ